MPEPEAQPKLKFGRKYLESILEFHHKRVEADLKNRNFESVFDSVFKGVSEGILPKKEFDFTKALSIKAFNSPKESSPKEIGIIAEIKRRSPSKGDLREELTSPELISLAKSFEQAGASGISVLTDEEHFGGSLDDLKSIVGKINLPILRKDFTLSGLDVIDAFVAGASAVLIIMAAFAEEDSTENSGEDSKAVALVKTAFQLGLDVFCEVHTLKELELISKLFEKFDTTNQSINPTTNQNANICILVNQRDLATFEEHPTRAVELAQYFSSLLPESCHKIAASCINSASAVQELAAADYSAVLVGEYLMKSQDPAASLAELLGQE